MQKLSIYISISVHVSICTQFSMVYSENALSKIKLMNYVKNITTVCIHLDAAFFQSCFAKVSRSNAQLLKHQQICSVSLSSTLPLCLCLSFFIFLPHSRYLIRFSLFCAVCSFSSARPLYSIVNMSTTTKTFLTNKMSVT